MIGRCDYVPVVARSPLVCDMVVGQVDKSFIPFLINHYTLKEFPILVTCDACGETFDSNYKLMKHVSRSHPPDVKPQWAEGDHSCSCGSHLHEH
jgi:hypothetical protein